MKSAMQMPATQTMQQNAFKVSALPRSSSSSKVGIAHGKRAMHHQALTRQLAKQIISIARSPASVQPLRAAATEVTTNPLNIVFVATEVAPWSKTGGLGDVVGGLPIELAKRGHHVITIAPRYDQYYDGWDTSVVITVDGETVRFFHAVKKGVHRVFIDHPWFLAKVWGKTGAKLYGPKSGADYIDNDKRFSVFCKAAVEAVRVLPFGPGEDCVFVANDWHSALVPVLIKDVYQPRGEFLKTKVAFCIHNIAFQGRMWEESFNDLGLPEASFEKFKFEDGYPKIYTETDPMDEDKPEPKSVQTYKKINWMKAGIMSADKVLTVSPNYATEIAADEAGGVELDTYIRAAGVEGIVNGMDIEEWDPRSDKFLDVNYDKTTVYAGKAAAKQVLQGELGLPVDPSVPLFAFIGRLEEQKGVDIMLKALEKLATANIQVAILGTGKAKMETSIKNLSKLSPGFKGVAKFSAPLAHLLTAGADYMLVPSRFEPCGLIQLHAMQYGTPPIVSSTGGLVDTVKEGITGFHMGAFDPKDVLPEDVESIVLTINRAAAAYSTPLYKDMVAASISQDLSWNKPTKKWEGVLEALMKGETTATEGSPAGVKVASVQTPVVEPLNTPKVEEIRATAAVPSTLPTPPVRPAGALTNAGAPEGAASPSAGPSAPAKKAVSAVGAAPSPSPVPSAAASNGTAKLNGSASSTEGANGTSKTAATPVSAPVAPTVSASPVSAVSAPVAPSVSASPVSSPTSKTTASEPTLVSASSKK